MAEPPPSREASGLPCLFPKYGFQFTMAKTDVNTEIRTRHLEGALLEREEELNLARAWRYQGDKAARDRLINAHQKLVMGMARKFERFNVPLADLFNEGMIALMVACQKYDPESGNRFATYAQWWVLTYLQEFVQRDTCPVRLGKTRIEKAVFRALARARRKYGPNLDDNVKEQIAKAFDITFEDVVNIEAATGIRTLSLNQSVSSEEEGGVEFIDTLADETQTPDTIIKGTLERTQLRIIKDILDQLDARETAVITHRFLSETPKTLRELAAELDISAERVRQIERETLLRMRRLIERAGLRADDLIGAAL